jgi:hypothetical protein
LTLLITEYCSIFCEGELNVRKPYLFWRRSSEATNRVALSRERERERERESKTLPLFNNYKGVPIGNLTSQIFANIYMNEFDQFIKHELKIKNYARYTDDFVIISDDKIYLQELLAPIAGFLKTKLHLDLHPKKIILKKHNQGIDFLGYVILPYHIKVRTKTKKKIPKKLHEIVKLYQNGQISEISLKSSLSSYLGVLSHADAYETSENIQNMFWFWMKE